jgi:hypothetical protein
MFLDCGIAVVCTSNFKIIGKDTIVTLRGFFNYGHYLQVNVVLHPCGSIAKRIHKKHVVTS